VLVRRALRDDADGLRDLEAQGVGPAALRSGLRLRALIVAVAGVLSGGALAAALVPLAAPAVRAAIGRAPDPAPATVVPGGIALVAALLLLAGAVLLGAAAAAPALREREPARAEGAA
jgi:hypothetical protein